MAPIVPMRGPRRFIAAALGVMVALAAWGPLFARAPISGASASAHPHQTSSPCACSKCPGETTCCCDHGQAPSGSTCSAPSQEPSGQADVATSPIAVGKLVFTAPALDLASEGVFLDPECTLVQRAYPYPDPLDKVPILPS